MPPKASKGAKAKKGLSAKKNRRGAGNARNNPKAFAASSGPKAMRNKAYRSLEKQEKQYHVQLTDRSVEATAAPPFTVVVVGPPGVGKTTVIQSLVKHWTKQTMSEVQGPVTVVTGKQRRLTIIECPNDINAMVDLSKVADLVLLVVDGSFGFEMETFEFLNMCALPNAWSMKRGRRPTPTLCLALGARDPLARNPPARPPAPLPTHPPHPTPPHHRDNAGASHTASRA